MDFKKFITEGTSTGDVAIHTGKLGLSKCECCGSKIEESAVGSVGRTGFADAKAHVTPELRAQFKKIVKQLGGKTVARQLLAEMNHGIQEGMKGAVRSDIESALQTLSSNCTVSGLEEAIDEVLDLMDLCK